MIESYSGTVKAYGPHERPSASLRCTFDGLPGSSTWKKEADLRLLRWENSYFQDYG